MRIIRTITLILLITLSSSAGARGVYQTPEAFIDQVFAGHPPAPERLWVDESLRDLVRDVLGHDLKVLRIRYWRTGDRTAWLLEEIGKEKPITTGIVVNSGQIESVRVLIFRESRGWEVRYPFFTDQFKGASLTDTHHLDRNIDGISGATLSVRAMEKLARLALVLHRQSDVQQHGAQLSQAP